MTDGTGPRLLPADAHAERALAEHTARRRHPSARRPTRGRAPVRLRVAPEPPDH